MAGPNPGTQRRSPHQSVLLRPRTTRDQLLQRVAVAAPEAPEVVAAAESDAAADEVPAVAATEAAAAPPTPSIDIPLLNDLELEAVINTQGRVAPRVQPGTAAAVFALYDQHQKLQYIGFSKDLQASLRTVLGRRPDKTYYFKSVQLPVVDQEGMLTIRQAWFDECGAPPPGNKLALERKAWQSAVDAGAISARAKPAAAAEKAKELQGLLKARGCVETFVPDPELMQDGQVDFLALTAGEQQQQELEQQQQSPGDAGPGAAAAAAAGSSEDGSSSSSRPVRTATVVVDGQAKQFMVEYLMKFPTKGGYMVDVKVSFDHMDTTHRIIVGRGYYEPYGIPVEAALEAALALLLALKLPRHNEGMLGTSEFPVNYFTVSEMEQWFSEEFAAQFLHMTGHELKDGMDFFWRMNKIHDYGSKLEDPTSLGAALARSGLGKV